MPRPVYTTETKYYQRADDMPMTSTVVSYQRPPNAPVIIQQSYVPRVNDTEVTQAEYDSLMYAWEQARLQAIEDNNEATVGG